jgi:tetratricopeptide (TPR) repeat protein
LENAYLGMRNHDAAIAQFNKALKRKPLAEALYSRGLAKRAKGDLAGGDIDIKQAIAFDPSLAR